VIVTSGFALTRRLPEGVKFMRKPWLPLDVLREGPWIGIPRTEVGLTREFGDQRLLLGQRAA
jgi:hypothetical protein